MWKGISSVRVENPWKLTNMLLLLAPNLCENDRESSLSSVRLYLTQELQSSTRKRLCELLGRSCLGRGSVKRK